MLLPAIEFLNSDFVQHIFISTDEYLLNADDVSILSLAGIPYSNGRKDPYKELFQQYLDAIQKCDFALIAKMISQYPLVAKLADQEGKQAIHLAALHGNCELIRRLMNVGCSLHTLDNQNRTPFMCAASTQSVDIILHFAAEFPQASSIQANENTPLMYACKNLNDESFAAILGVSPIHIINTKNAEGESALFLAVKENKLNKVNALLGIPGIDYTAARIPGDQKTALIVSRENKHFAISKLLITHAIRLNNNRNLSAIEVQQQIDLELSLATLDDIEQLFKTHMTGFKVITQEIQEILTNFQQLFNELKAEDSHGSIKEKCLALLNFLTTARQSVSNLTNTQFLMWKSRSDLSIKLNDTIKNTKTYLQTETTFLTEPNPVAAKIEPL